MGKSTFLQEFKAFAMKGNVVDMAVGVIIGGAFGKIVSSVVADVIMPPIGLLVGGVNFTDLKWVMKDAVAEVKDEAGNVITAAQDAVTLNYGNFIQTILDFLIIALAIFLVIKLMATAKSKLIHEKVEEPAPATTKVCPFCCTEIPIDAVKCPHCTSDLPEDKSAE